MKKLLTCFWLLLLLFSLEISNFTFVKTNTYSEVESITELNVDDYNSSTNVVFAEQSYLSQTQFNVKITNLNENITSIEWYLNDSSTSNSFYEITGSQNFSGTNTSEYILLDNLSPGTTYQMYLEFNNSGYKEGDYYYFTTPNGSEEYYFESITPIKLSNNTVEMRITFTDNVKFTDSSNNGDEAIDFGRFDLQYSTDSGTTWQYLKVNTSDTASSDNPNEPDTVSGSCITPCYNYLIQSESSGTSLQPSKLYTVNFRVSNSPSTYHYFEYTYTFQTLPSNQVSFVDQNTLRVTTTYQEANSNGTYDIIVPIEIYDSQNNYKIEYRIDNGQWIEWVPETESDDVIIIYNVKYVDENYKYKIEFRYAGIIQHAQVNYNVIYEDSTNINFLILLIVLGIIFTIFILFSIVIIYKKIKYNNGASQSME